MSVVGTVAQGSPAVTSPCSEAPSVARIVVNCVTKRFPTLRCNRIERVATNCVLVEKPVGRQVVAPLADVIAVIVDIAGDVGGLKFERVLVQELQYLDVDGHHDWSKGQHWLTPEKDIRGLIDYTCLSISVCSHYPISTSSDFRVKTKVPDGYVCVNDCRRVPGRSKCEGGSAPVKERFAVVLPMKANDRARMYAPGMDNCIGTRDSYHPAKQRVAA